MKSSIERPLVSSAVFQHNAQLEQAIRQALFAFASLPQAQQSQQQQAAHTAIETATGTTYSVCATLPATYDAAGYGATTLTYSAVGKCQDFPGWGLERPTGEFRPISGDVEKYDGSPGYGGGDWVMGDVVGDAGQAILKTASESTTRAHITIKGTRPDTAVFYLDVIVSSWKLSAAKENTPYLRTAMVQVCRAPIIVAAS